jgi:sugar phosphate isomerase/epimerase
MPYKVGVSSGWWKIGKDPALLGLATKVGGFGATMGVQFIQADLDTTSEFFEPELNYQMRRVKEDLGLEVALHGEVGELMALESAERRLWEQSHLRLIETIKHAAEFGLTYVNIHSSNRPLLMFLEAQIRAAGYYYPVVDFKGRPLWVICEKHPKTKEMTQRHMSPYLRHSEAHAQEERKIEQEEMKHLEEMTEKIIEEAKKAGKVMTRDEAEGWAKNEIYRRINEKLRDPEFLFKVWKKAGYETYLLSDGEFGAYHIVAMYLKETNDQLWRNIANGKDPEKLYNEDERMFSAAVAAKYIEGHLTVTDHKLNKEKLGGKSILEFLEEKKLYLLFEVPEAHEGHEGLLRLFHPLHIYYMLKKLNSPFVKMCIDFEHIISNKLNPMKDVIEKFPNDAGNMIFLVHVGTPKPYWGTAHIPLAIGSRAQEIIYRWLYALRKKGFTNGYMIYERGSGRTGKGTTGWDVMEHSVWTMRQVAEYLDKDVPPSELPPEFYGVSEHNPEVFRRSWANIYEHAFDPIQGLLSVPEESHTFLGKAAVEKGKKKEWERGRFR